MVSLLENDEIAELDLQDLPEACRAIGIDFISFPFPDRGVPASVHETNCLVHHLSDAIAGGKGVAIHCRAGIGRSSLIAACILARKGYDVDSAYDIISAARGLKVPDTQVQRDWVSALPDATV